jgi:hypothetical protein
MGRSILSGGRAGEHLIDWLKAGWRATAHTARQATI